MGYYFSPFKPSMTFFTGTAKNNKTIERQTFVSQELLPYTQNSYKRRYLSFEFENGFDDIKIPEENYPWNVVDSSNGTNFVIESAGYFRKTPTNPNDKRLFLVLTLADNSIEYCFKEAPDSISSVHYSLDQKVRLFLQNLDKF